MAVPFYVSPDQIMQDKAEYARKGIAKGRSIVAVEYADGLLLMAENPSASLNKISEIYDRIAFAGVGKYSEFENLRKAGIRYADLKGYSYSRQDVTTKSLANAYSETIGTIFTRDPKPLEVEILVVEVGETPAQNEMYHVSFDGTITDRQQFAVIGGQADRIRTYLQEHYQSGHAVGGSVGPQPSRVCWPVMSDRQPRRALWRLASWSARASAGNSIA